MPGIAIWHMSFLEKDDTSDWQAYFHYRNRLVAAAMHGPDDPQALLTDILKRTVRHLMLMEYSAVALQHMALRDFLAGPETLFPKPAGGAGRGPGDARRVRRRPPARLGDPGPAEQPGRAGRPGLPGAADHASRRSSKQLARSVRPQPAHARTRRTTTCRSATCRPGRRSGSCCPRLDSATVSTPDGRGVTFRRRDPQLFRSQLKTSAQLLGAAAREWPNLRRRYREAAPHLTSREGWKQIFEA